MAVNPLRRDQMAVFEQWLDRNKRDGRYDPRALKPAWKAKLAAEPDLQELDAQVEAYFSRHDAAVKPRPRKFGITQLALFSATDELTLADGTRVEVARAYQADFVSAREVRRTAHLREEYDFVLDDQRLSQCIDGFDSQDEPFEAVAARHPGWMGR